MKKVLVAYLKKKNNFYKKSGGQNKNSKSVSTTAKVTRKKNPKH